MKQVESIISLADAYASHLQVGNFDDADNYRDELRSAVEELAKDAERYRWLRSLEHCNEAWCFIGEGNANSNLDKAIDAAMKGQS